jgi:hypothetical protein
MASKLGLAEYVEQHGGRPKHAWAETSLPAEIKEEIFNQPSVGARTITRWLHTLGYTEATESKIEYLRRNGPV